MSNRLLSDAFELSKATGLTKFVLIFLAFMADKDGFCAETFSHIALSCAVSEQAVHRAISELVKLGELEISAKKIGNGNDIPTLYRVLIGQKEVVGGRE